MNGKGLSPLSFFFYQINMDRKARILLDILQAAVLTALLSYVEWDRNALMALVAGCGIPSLVGALMRDFGKK